MHYVFTLPVDTRQFATIKEALAYLATKETNFLGNAYWIQELFPDGSVGEYPKPLVVLDPSVVTDRPAVRETKEKTESSAPAGGQTTPAWAEKWGRAKSTPDVPAKSHPAAEPQMEWAIVTYNNFRV